MIFRYSGRIKRLFFFFFWFFFVFFFFFPVVHTVHVTKMEDVLLPFCMHGCGLGNHGFAHMTSYFFFILVHLKSFPIHYSRRINKILLNPSVSRLFLKEYRNIYCLSSQFSQKIAGYRGQMQRSIHLLWPVRNTFFCLPAFPKDKGHNS